MRDRSWWEILLVATTGIYFCKPSFTPRRAPRIDQEYIVAATITSPPNDSNCMTSDLFATMWRVIPMVVRHEVLVNVEAHRNATTIVHIHLCCRKGACGTL